MVFQHFGVFRYGHKIRIRRHYYWLLLRRLYSMIQHYPTNFNQCLCGNLQSLTVIQSMMSSDELAKSKFSRFFKNLLYNNLSDCIIASCCVGSLIYKQFWKGYLYPVIQRDTHLTPSQLQTKMKHIYRSLSKHTGTLINCCWSHKESSLFFYIVNSQQYWLNTNQFNSDDTT